MMRKAFQDEKRRLQDRVLALGSSVRQALADAVRALRTHDTDEARRIIEGDREVNATRFGIEADTLTLIATQQPMARDLRELAAILEIITELERIGDYAKGIARISLMMGDVPPIEPMVDIERMADKARELLQRALDAYVQQDADTARMIPREDDLVDEIYNRVYRELLGHIIADPANLEQANYLLWVAHNVERAADRVTNICERVVFTATGEMTELDTADLEEGLSGIS